MIPADAHGGDCRATSDGTLLGLLCGIAAASAADACPLIDLSTFPTSASGSTATKAIRLSRLAPRAAS
jgi:hypothetical protein